MRKRGIQISFVARLGFFCSSVIISKDERTDKRTPQKGEKKKVKRRSHTFEEEKE